MSVSGVFKKFVEPCLERIPVLEVTHCEGHQGRTFVITQIVQRNVFTDFDRKLSRHLAATRGTGFPRFTVAVEVAERGGAAPKPLAQAHYASVPHALKGIAERAFGRDGRAELTVHHDDPAAGERAAGVKRTVTTDDIDALDAGLGICRLLGEPEFLDLSGDFDVVMAGPPGGELRPVVMHLKNGSASVPCQTGTTITPFECPLHGFVSHMGESVLAQGYMAQARHALVAVKEAAVTEFREAAERQILSFDRALAGRPLDGHKLESAMALIERLKAGLGSSLNGLSEDARITALDWSVTIETGGEPGDGAGQVSKHIALAHAAGA